MPCPVERTTPDWSTTAPSCSRSSSDRRRQVAPSKEQLRRSKTDVLGPKQGRRRSISKERTLERVSSVEEIAPQLDKVWNSRQGRLNRGETLVNIDAPLPTLDQAAIWKKFGRGTCIIDPRRHRWVAYWDLVMIFVLLFASVVTPFEVAFLEDAHCITIMFLVNRVVDFLFCLDIVIIFNSAYSDPKTGKWITSRRQIASRYLAGWFLIE